jgi:hypothetical protein
MAALRRVGHHTAVVRSLDDFLSAVLSTNPKFL